MVCFSAAALVFCHASMANDFQDPCWPRQWSPTARVGLRPDWHSDETRSARFLQSIRVHVVRKCVQARAPQFVMVFCKWPPSAVAGQQHGRPAGKEPNQQGCVRVCSLHKGTCAAATVRRPTPHASYHPASVGQPKRWVACLDSGLLRVQLGLLLQDGQPVFVG